MLCCYVLGVLRLLVVLGFGEDIADFGDESAREQTQNLPPFEIDDEDTPAAVCADSQCVAKNDATELCWYSL